MVLMAAALGAGGAVWLLGLAIIVFGDACSAPCLVIIFVVTISIAVPGLVVRNWAKGGGHGADSPAGQ